MLHEQARAVCAGLARDVRPHARVPSDGGALRRLRDEPHPFACNARKVVPSLAHLADAPPPARAVRINLEVALTLIGVTAPDVM